MYLSLSHLDFVFLKSKKLFDLNLLKWIEYKIKKILILI